MGGVLDGAWPLILEALDHLDRIVLMPAANIPPAEQAFVASALGNVSKSSKFLEDQPLISLLQAMVKSAQTGVAQQPVRLFGLTRLVETINVNIERLPVRSSLITCTRKLRVFVVIPCLMLPHLHRLFMRVGVLGHSVRATSGVLRAEA